MKRKDSALFKPAITFLNNVELESLHVAMLPPFLACWLYYSLLSGSEQFLYCKYWRQ